MKRRISTTSRSRMKNNNSPLMATGSATSYGRDLVMVGVGLALAFVMTSLFYGLKEMATTSSSEHVVTNTKSNHYSSRQALRSAASDDDARENGFHSLHIYYGKMNELVDQIPKDKFWQPAYDTNSWVEPEGRQWFAQHGQDIAVMKALNFRRNGFFVDLAANDAVWASNTFALEQHFGWRGICIEANPIYWHRLSSRRCHVVGAIVGGDGTDGEDIQVHLSKDRVHGPYGGIVGQNFDNKKAKANEAEHRYTVSLKTILRKFNAPKVIDFLSLDVEGAELFIMKDFPFDEYRFLAMTVERPPDELQAIFAKNGYKKALEIKRGDTLWVHESLYDDAVQRLAVNPKEIDQHRILDNIPSS